MINKTFFVILALALVATAVAYHRSPSLAWQGANSAGKMFINILPSMLAGFLLGGMVQVLLPRDLVAAYAGEDSGFVGLLIAAIVGMFTPGGPFIAFPLVASLWKAGTGVGPLISFLTAWSLMGMHRIFIYEAPILGWRFTVARLFAVMTLPLFAGFVGSWIFRRLGE